MSGYDSGLYDDGVYDGELSLVPVTIPTPAVPARPVDEVLAEALAQASHVAVARITVLERDLSTVRRRFDLDQRAVLAGGCTAELRRDVRRYGSVQLENADGSLAPALADDLFAEGSPVVMERGVIVDGTPLYVTLLTGFVTGCVPDMAGTMDLSVEGYLSALRQDTGGAVTIPARTFLVDALHTLWDPVLPAATWIVEPPADERAVGADIPVLATDQRLAAGLAMADALGVDVFDDRLGRIVVRVRPDYTTQATAHVMTDPLTLQRTIGQRAYNAQGVESSPADAEPFYVVVEVDDPSSPLHRDRIGGLRMAPTIQTDAAPDPDTARAMGRAALVERAAVQDTLEVTSPPVHLDLDAGDIVERTEPVSGTSGRFVLDVVTIPMGPGPITTSERSIVLMFLGDA